MSGRYGKQIEFMVYGEPIPKRDGQSKTAFVNGKPIVRRFTTTKLRDWHNRVMDVAITTTQDMKRPVFPKGAVRLDLEFRMPKPKSAKKHEEWKYTRPDGDRLQCAVQDALQGIVYTLDSQVAEWYGRKRWVTGPPGVFIRVTEIIAQKDGMADNADQQLAQQSLFELAEVGCINPNNVEG